MAIRDADGFELFDHDALTGRTVWKYFDGEKTVFRTDYPVDQLISVNAEQRAISQRGWAGDLHHIASIPPNVAWDSGMVDAFNQNDDKFMSKFLNDSDNRAWRTKEGTV